MAFIHIASTILLAGLVIVAAYWDVKTSRIPNRLTYAMILAGMVLGLLAGGRAELIRSIGGMAAGGGIFLLFWVLKAMGGGDVKLMAGVGAFLGWPAVLDALFWTALCGGVMGLLFIIWKWRGKSHEAEEGTIPVRKQTLPYGVAIAVGTIVSLVI